MAQTSSGRQYDALQPVRSQRGDADRCIPFGILLLTMLGLLGCLREIPLYTTDNKPSILLDLAALTNARVHTAAAEMSKNNTHNPVQADVNQTSSHTSPNSSASFCNLDIKKINASCPRFIFNEMGPHSPGLGDRFMRHLLIPMVFALDAKATPVRDSTSLTKSGEHGQYPWADGFFNMEYLTLDIDEAMQAYNVSNVVTIPPDVTSYEETLRLASLHCHAIIKIHMNICGGSCYFLKGPRLQRLHRILECAFLRGNWNALPVLTFDPSAYYTVTIHIRTGDINLHADAPAYFRRLYKQLKYYTKEFSQVQYLLIAEAPGQEDFPGFEFLGDIFMDEPPRVKVSHLNMMTVPEALFHMMNSDMLVTTGSSFPYIAIMLSPKPVVVFGKPKEGSFFPGLLREDLIHLEDDGFISHPTPTEIQALIGAKYAEVHGRVFPFDFLPS